MKREPIILWKEEEYSYPMAHGFIPNIMTFVSTQSALVHLSLKQPISRLFLISMVH